METQNNQEPLKTQTTVITKAHIQQSYPVHLTKKEYYKLLELLEDKPKKVATFEKVSLEKWDMIPDDAKKLLEKNGIKETDLPKMIDELKTPKRSTETSAGYDFFMPFDAVVEKRSCLTIPTGIRVKMKPNYVLMVFPRSSLGFKYKSTLSNTVGIIDSDYYYADNDGHIIMKILNNSDEKDMVLKKGDKFCQGIFVEYGVTENDDEDGHQKRTGGMGSTGN